jgi:hypothetical protein
MLVGIVLSLATDAMMHAIGYFPPIGQSVSSGPLIPATIYRAIYGVIGAYVTARLAPNRAMFHAMVLGTLGLIVCIAGAVFTWNRGPEFGPHWYPVALIVLALPTAWLGGWLGGRKVANQ